MRNRIPMFKPRHFFIYRENSDQLGTVHHFEAILRWRAVMASVMRYFVKDRAPEQITASHCLGIVFPRDRRPSMLVPRQPTLKLSVAREEQHLAFAPHSDQFDRHYETHVISVSLPVQLHATRQVFSFSINTAPLVVLFRYIRCVVCNR